MPRFNSGPRAPGSLPPSTVVPQFPAQEPVSGVGANGQSTNVLPVADVSTIDGANGVELAAQTLLELRIMNQQLYTLLTLLAPQVGLSAPDEPRAFRAEPSALQ